MGNVLNIKNILHLKFREGRGHLLQDSSGCWPEAEIQYRFRNPRYIEAREPSWRSCGVEGPALLFDGNSTAIRYPAGRTAVAGKALTFSAWIAPRAFPCWDPENDDGEVTGITAVLAQLSPESPHGFLLGYEALGQPCLQIGSGSRRWVVRSDQLRLVPGEWNHLAAVVDGERGSMCLYLDGQQAGRTCIPAGTEVAPAEGHSLRVGENEGGKEISAGRMDMFCGLICEVRIEAAVLSPEEIAQRAALSRPAIPWEEIGPEDILGEDPYKTRIHGGPRQHWMNEPHAPLYYMGVYHLFFQSNCIGTYWGNIAWGHLVSRDLVHWRQVRDALVPSAGTVAPDGIWTGGATLDEDGIPVLFFTAADLTYSAHGLISNQNIGAAWPADLTDPKLKEWVMMDHLAVTQQPGMGRKGEFRDPHVWREPDGSWYMVVCGGSVKTDGGATLLFRTDRLRIGCKGQPEMNWQYLGPAFEMENPEPVYGTSWELPILMPVEDRTGRIHRHALFLMPAPPDRADNKVYYYVGTFLPGKGNFIPDPEFGSLPRLLDYGDNIFTGPSVLRDPESGRICLFSIMQDQRSPAEESEAGWAHCVGLTRNLWLREDGTDLCVEPDPRLDLLLGTELICLEETDSEQANRELARIREDLYCLKAVVEPEGAFTLTMQADKMGRGNVFRFEPREGKISGIPGFPGCRAGKTPVEGCLRYDNGCVEMEIFVDRSLTEGFFNRDKALSIRSYAPVDARRICFTGEGKIRIRSLRIWRLNPLEGRI